MTDPLFTHLYGSVPEDAAPKAPGLTPTITLPVTEYDDALAQARADGMRAELERFKALDDDLIHGLGRVADAMGVDDLRSLAQSAIWRIQGLTAERDAALAPAPAVPADADHACALNRAMDGTCMECGSVDKAMRAKAEADDANAAITALRARQTPAPQVPPEVLRQVVAFNEIAAARKAHVDAVEAYNARRALVMKERERGEWGLSLDSEYQAMCAAQSEFIGVAQRVADAALAAVQPYVEGV